jgi:hypothetical protein
MSDKIRFRKSSTTTAIKSKTFIRIYYYDGNMMIAQIYLNVAIKYFGNL